MTTSQRTSLFIGTILIQLLGAFSYFILAQDPTIIRFLYLLTKGLMLFAPILLLLLGLPLPRITLRVQMRKSLLWGISSGALIAGLILLVFTIFRPAFSPFSEIITTKVDALGIASFYVLFAIFISLIHSLFEEYYWRWYVVRGLETCFSPTQAILIGNTGFALHHYVLLSQFFPWYLTVLFGTCVGIGGVIWSMMYRKTGSLLAPWLSHILADCAILSVGYLLMNL